MAFWWEFFATTEFVKMFYSYCGGVRSCLSRDILQTLGIGRREKMESSVRILMSIEMCFGG